VRSSEGDERCTGVMYACDIITVGVSVRMKEHIRRMVAAYWLVGHCQLPQIRVETRKHKR